MFAKLERQKAETLGLIEDWSASRLAYRPAADAWSAIEVLDHVVKVESGIIAAARRGLQKPHRIGLRDRVGFLFIERVFRSRRRVKVPSSAPQVLPDSNATPAAVRERWAESRDDLALLLAQVTPDQLRAGVFRHPVSGWMSLPQILRFFSVHIRHHGFQLARLGAASEGL